MRNYSNIPVIILLTVFAIGCRTEVNQKSTNWNFDSIQLDNELYLFHTDDRFGEWGGNTYVIKLYRPSQKEELRIDYKEYAGKAGPPDPPDPNSKDKINPYSEQPIIDEKLDIVATDEQLKLISLAIQNLLASK